jgi:translation initiation factor 1
MSDLVYSSDGGDRRKGNRDVQQAPAVTGRPKVRRETSGRRGKEVTTVSNLPLAEADLKQLATKLKKRCGVGGSAKNGIIELQGDHRDAVMATLREAGYDPVLAGG